VAEVAPVRAKSKKMMIIIVGAVLVVALAGFGAFFFISKQRAASAEDGEEPTSAKVAHSAPKGPPVYLPLDPMVVNLADPGGEKVAQVGITLEVTDSKASDTVKQYLPTIRSSVLLLISQRTAEELLKPEGKEKLAEDVLQKASIPFTGETGDPLEKSSASGEKSKSAKGKAAAESPIVGVLFSSFIIQ